MTVVRQAVSKVPQITIFFWVTKLLTTAMGEATSDYLVRVLNPVLAVGLGGLALIAALVMQFRSPRYVPWIYWLAVAMVAVAGTMAADVLHKQFGVPYGVSTPFFAIVLRKAYGLGAQAMAGGSTLAPTFCAAWPTGEFGGMGLEGAVRLGYRRELEAETNPEKHQALFDQLLGGLYRAGKAINVAASLEIDAVIDPADTRHWIIQGLKTCKPRRGERRRFVDAW